MTPIVYVVFYTSCDTYSSKTRYTHKVEIESAQPLTSRAALRYLRSVGVNRPKVTTIHRGDALPPALRRGR